MKTSHTSRGVATLLLSSARDGVSSTCILAILIVLLALHAARASAAFPDAFNKPPTGWTGPVFTLRAHATRDAVLAELGSGKYDVVHYAGHAFFDPDQRARSGILCHGDQVLSGAQLAELRSLPSLAFFNACESARVRSGKARGDASFDMGHRIQRNVGLAEAFLRGGIANYIGTYWPVGDAAAERFATTFYGQLVGGESLGNAIQTARGAVQKTGSIDWADYVHYGTQDFVLKTRA